MLCARNSKLKDRNLAVAALFRQQTPKGETEPRPQGRGWLRCTELRSRGRADPRRGATLIEFALTFLLFVVTLVGLVESARLVWTYTTLAHAARRGARFVMVHNGRNPASDEQVEEVVKKYAIGLDSDAVTVQPTYDDAAMSGGSTATVAVSYPFQFFASPLVFSANGLTLTATSKTTLAE